VKEKSISVYEIGLILLLSSVLCTSYAIYAGQDINWDQRNYHVYSVYALLNGRIGYDIAPSQLQTWLNPLGSLLQYFMIFGTAPVVASIVLSVLASLTVCLVYLLASRIFAPTRRADWKLSILLNGASALGALTAPIFLSELGTTFNDYIAWLFVLSAIVVFLTHRDRAISLFSAGALLGIAVSIKLTALIYVFGFGVAVLADDIRRSLRRAIPVAMGFLVCFGLLGGIWMAYIYKLFGNPVFPFYNNIFKSADYSTSAMLGQMRFVPKDLNSIWRHITGIAYGAHPTAEVRFYDTRFVFAILVIGLSLPQLIRSMFLGRAQRAVCDKVVNWVDARFVFVFTISAFCYWILKFGIERYAIGIEQLAVLCILCGIAALTDDRVRTATAAVMVTSIILATTRPANWGRTNFSGSWFDMKIPKEIDRPNVLYVMLSDEPTAFIIPFLPPSNRFVRIEGIPITPQHGLGRKLMTILERHTGEIRTLSPAGQSLEKSIPSLQLYGLVPTDGPCFRIESKAGSVETCPLLRAMQ
jgi:hypothetical protein